jgi:hypothetical protein
LLDGVSLPIPPETPEYGVTQDKVWSRNLTIIFLETLRDANDDFTTEAHTLVHELGHAGRDDGLFSGHASTGLMKVGAPKGESSFDDETKAIIRQKAVW